MKNFQHDHPELFKLFVRLNEGLLNEVERVQLNGMLLNEAEARIAYRQYMTLIAGLTWEFDASGQAHSAETIVARDQKLPPASNRQYVFALTKRFGWQRIAASLLLAVGFYGAFAFVVWQMSQYTVSPTSNHSPQLVDGLEAGRPIVTLIAADDCRWSGETSTIAVGTALLPGELELLSGTAELAFISGAQVIMEGPARFTPQTAGRGSLEHGKLVAHVPQRAVGFTVLTPTAEIVDRGTEFGVDVDVAGRTDIEVITGQVDVCYASSAKPNEARHTVRMTSGAAKRFSTRAEGDAVAVTPIAPWIGKTAIGKRLAKQTQELPAETKYAATVLADHPLGYWRLADGGKELAADSSGHGLHGRYRGVVSTSNPGICKNSNDSSVRFLGRSFEGWIEIPEVELPPSYTIEFWARSASPEWNNFGWLISCDISPGAVVHPEQGTRGVSLYIVNDKGQMRPALYYEPNNISDRFHYYVWCYDAEADHVSSYFDGDLVAEHSESLKPERRTRGTKLTLVIGRQHGFGAERSGEGWVDELAVYSHSLKAEAIRRHFEAVGVAATNIPSSFRSD